MTRRRAYLFLAASAIVVIAAWATALVVLRPSHLRARIERVVSRHLHLTTTIGELSVHWRGRAVLEADDVALRVPDRPDLPPFVAIERVTIESSPTRLFGELLRGRVQLVHMDGLTITIPPGEAKAQAMQGASKGRDKSKVVIERLLAHDATLKILRRASDRPPLVFDIHALDMHDLGFEDPIPFHAELRNPVPDGEVVSTGTVGPWQTSPSDLPLEGDYTFKNANLDTIRGIGGMLTSTGHYVGSLSELRVAGSTDTPDFNLDIGGRPVPLSTSFVAVVNGSNGTTHLDSVTAQLYHTTFHVSGDIVNRPGPEGFDIALKADVEHGHIEDVLSLAMDAKQPPFTGDMSMRSTVKVPFGRNPVRDRLQIAGAFSLAQARFTDGKVEQRLETLSRHGQGKDDDAPMNRVVSDMSGTFRLASHAVTLEDLRFAVPGATVALDGRYETATQVMAFEGQLQMQASLSDAVGGFKSIFIKPFDWFFRRDGHGTVIPIRIEGTRMHPQFSVRIGAALTRGK
jgi:hypothetical protein